MFYNIKWWNGTNYEKSKYLEDYDLLLKEVSEIIHNEVKLLKNTSTWFNNVWILLYWFYWFYA